jgi:hypothetical protein
VIFNASLHHCHDPVDALAKSRGLLKRDGRAVLLQEPILKPFRTKAWYFKRLKEDPRAMGHLGGNERVYYSWEYSRMLREAGFTNVRAVPSTLLRDLRANLVTIAKARTQHGYVYSEKKLVQHFAWNALMHRLLDRGRLANVLSRLSLIPLNFEASTT